MDDQTNYPAPETRRGKSMQQDIKFAKEYSLAISYGPSVCNMFALGGRGIEAKCTKGEFSRWLEVSKRRMKTRLDHFCFVKFTAMILNASLCKC